MPFRIITGIAKQVVKPSDTHCAPREHCGAAKYCAPNTTFNSNTKICEPNPPPPKK